MFSPNASSSYAVSSSSLALKGHSVANAVARMGGFLCPFLVQDITPFWIVGSTMFLLHTISAFCVLWLPETKRRKLGAVS